MTRTISLFLLAILLSACGDSSTTTPSNNGLRLELDGPSFFFAPVFDEDVQKHRAVLHSVDNQSIEQEIDLLASGGIADFGELDRDLATVTVIQQLDPGFIEIVTLNDLAVGQYETATPSPCSNQVQINLTVDASGATGGSTNSVGVSGFAGQTVFQGSSESVDRVEVQGLAACGGGAGRLFAMAYEDGRPDVWALENVPNMQDDGDYTVAVNQAAASIPIADMDPMPDALGMSTLISGQFVGVEDYVENPSADTPLFGALGAPSASIALFSERLSDSGSADLVRAELHDSVPSEARVTPWQAELALEDYDETMMEQGFSFSSSATPRIAHLYYVLRDDDDEIVGTWNIFGDAQRGAMPIPVLPQNEENLVERESLEQGPQGFSIMGFGNAAGADYQQTVREFMSLGLYEFLSQHYLLASAVLDDPTDPQPGPTDPPTPTEPPDGETLCIPFIEVCLF